MSTTTTTDQIHDFGARWVEAELTGDVSRLAPMVTDDFRLVGPFGFVLDKHQWLNRYASGDFETTALTWHDVDIRQYGDCVITIGTQSQEAAFQGNPSNGDFRVSHVFVRDGDSDRWVIASIQLSLAAPPGPPPGAGAPRPGGEAS